jgi:hypothetical protein
MLWRANELARKCVGALFLLDSLNLSPFLYSSTSENNLIVILNEFGQILVIGELH